MQIAPSITGEFISRLLRDFERSQLLPLQIPPPHLSPLTPHAHFVVPDVTGQEVTIGARHRLSLAIPFQTEKACSKVSNDAFYSMFGR
jgi:hypothetical protein